jgi:hypothetical protein
VPLRFRHRLALVLSLCLCCMLSAAAQDLAPRAYVITPLHANAVTLTWSFYTGGIDFNGAVPVTGATGTYSVPVFSYYHSLSFFRFHSPMAWGHLVAMYPARTDLYIVPGYSILRPASPST